MTVLTLNSVSLPLDLVWVDEFDWTPTEQHQTRSLTGALVVETAQKSAGRPITLSDGTAPVFVNKATVGALFTLLDTVTPMTLTVQDGRTFSVIFRHEDKPLEAKPIIDYQVMDDTDYYQVTIKLMDIAGGYSGGGGTGGGGTGGGGTTQAEYTHYQTTPSTTWIINHNLGRYPSIQVMSVGGIEFIADIQHTSTNQSIITLSSAVAGIAQCN